MAAMDNDMAARTDLGIGLVLAIASAASFGLSGALARGLLDAGWSAGAVVLVRIAIGAVVVAPVAARALRGRWGALRANAGLILLFGAVAVAGAQFAYFSAVQRMDVGPALLIEYTAPAAVVVWLWLRHGERPSPLTVSGAGLAALGLVLVLDLLSGADLDPVGVLWALIAMGGAASYFVLGANQRPDLPPVALAGAGLATGRSDSPRWALSASCRCTPRRPHPRTLAKPSAGGSRFSDSASSPPGSPTAPASRQSAASARAWRRSSRCSRSSPAWRSRGCCSTSSQGRCSSSAAR